MTAPLTKLAAPDLTKDLDLTLPELHTLLNLAADLKAVPHHYASALEGKSIALLFEKPSLRTRMTFEVAIHQLGGFAITNNGMIGAREPLKDVARNLERWFNGIVARTFTQKTIDDLAKWSKIPIINALSDLYHPCQALADMQTVKERFGDWRGVKFAFVGDGNNVSHSLMLCAARLGMHFTLAHPKGYEAVPEIIAEAKVLATHSGASITITTSPEEAARDANVIYTDVWASMGDEDEAAERRTAFSDYQVDEDLFALADPDAIFLHCLPAKRGEEVTDGVMESPRSAVFDQAENRLHAQKALLLMLL